MSLKYERVTVAGCFNPLIIDDCPFCPLTCPFCPGAVDTLQHQRTALGKALTARTHGDLHESFHNWADTLQHQRAARERALTARLRRRITASRGAFGRWVVWHTEEVRHEQVATALGKARTHGDVHESFRAWVTSVDALQHRRTALEGALKIWTRRKLLVVVRGWCAHVDTLQHHRTALERVLTAWTHGELHDSFLTWHTSVRLWTAREKSAVKLVGKARTLRELHAPFRTWEATLVEERDNRVKMGKGLKMWTRRTLHEPFRAWAAKLATHKRHEQVADTVVARRRTKAIHEPFRVWEATRATQKRERAVLTNVERKVLARTHVDLYVSFRAWEAALATQKRQRTAVGKVLKTLNPKP